MKLAHQINISVFIHEHEDREKIYNKLISLVPFDLKGEKITLKEDTAIGFNEKKIKIYEIILEKDRHINEFLKYLLDKLGEEQKQLLLKQKESRLDNELKFFIRLDKEKLLKENKFRITDSGNCFHIKMSVAAFPAKREKAIEALNKLLS